MVKATWGMEYDWRNDETYIEPQHEECGAPIALIGDEYVCIGCGEPAEITDEMEKWFQERTGTKIETEECLFCHKKKMKVVYHKNKNTKKWEAGHGECSSCGVKFIV